MWTPVDWYVCDFLWMQGTTRQPALVGRAGMSLSQHFSPSLQSSRPARRRAGWLAHWKSPGLLTLCQLLAAPCRGLRAVQKWGHLLPHQLVGCCVRLQQEVHMQHATALCAVMVDLGIPATALSFTFVWMTSQGLWGPGKHVQPYPNHQVPISLGLCHPVCLF